MKKILISILVIILHLNTNTQPALEVFSPQTFAGFPNVRELTILLDGSEMYFSVQSKQQDFSTIMVSKKGKKGWGKTEVVSFSGQFKYIKPFFNLHYSVEVFILMYNLTKALKTNALSSLNPDI